MSLSWSAQAGDDILLLLCILLQQFIGVVADLFADMGILDIEVVVAGFDVVDGHFPRLFGFHPCG